MGEKRNCPFCGATLVLGELPIAATNRHTIDVVDDRHDDQKMSSGTPVLSWVESIDRFPVIGNPPLWKNDALRSRRSPKQLWPLPPVTTAGSAEDLPARLCTSCQFPLPQGIDDRRVFTIALVGTGASGKTHYLASALREAYRFQGLEPFCCDEFMPEEETAIRYDEEFYAPLFEELEVLGATQSDDEVRFKPLTFKVTFEDCKPCLVMFHDVSGEIFKRRDERVSTTSFVRRADAVIFLVDPEASRQFRRPGTTRPPNQAAMLAGCVDDLDPKRRRTIPFAVTLSKSDLLASAMPERRFTFAAEPPADPVKWQREFRQIDYEVRGVLPRSA